MKDMMNSIICNVTAEYGGLDINNNPILTNIKKHKLAEATMNVIPAVGEIVRIGKDNFIVLHVIHQCRDITRDIDYCVFIQVALYNNMRNINLDKYRAAVPLCVDVED